MGAEQGNTIWAGNIKNGRLYHEWQSGYVNGRPMDAGKLINGVPTGEWKYWDSCGQLRAVRHYNHDKLHKVKEEIRLGHPRNFFFPITALYRKNGIAAVRFLTAAFSFPNTNGRSETELTDRIRNNANAQGYYPPFSECLHHGIFLNYFRNGRTRDSGYFDNGLPHGVWVHYNTEGGSSWQGEYKDGVRQREWKLFDARGKLLKIVFYDRAGNETWRKEF
jgi:antitoxin component YwqK of YwqJK toxin-antitoxin module